MAVLLLANGIASAVTRTVPSQGEQPQEPSWELGSTDEGGRTLSSALLLIGVFVAVVMGVLGILMLLLLSMFAIDVTW